MVRYSSLIQTMTVSSISVRARSPHYYFIYFFYLFIFFVESTSLALFYDMAASTSGKEEANPVF